jgi:oxaloacetate decarboxylase alpha subunit
MDKLIFEVQEKAKAERVRLTGNIEEDALINGMFAQVGWKFLANRGKPEAFEAAPNASAAAVETSKAKDSPETYSVNVDGKNFTVTVGPVGAEMVVQPASTDTVHVIPTASSGSVISAPMAGNILKIPVQMGSVINEGDVVVIMEAMKMETEIRSKFAGIVSEIHVKEGGAVAGGSALITL